MLYTEMNKTKQQIMAKLEQSVDNMFEQLQANELGQQRILPTEAIANLQVGTFEAYLIFDIPRHLGTNSWTDNKSWTIYCNPTYQFDEYRYISKYKMTVRKQSDSE